MTGTTLLISMLVFIIFFIPYLLARRTWHHSGIMDALILVVNVGIVYMYGHFVTFDYHLMSSLLMIAVIFWFRNPLQIVKGFFLISMVNLVTTLLTFTVFFKFWIDDDLNLSFLLFGLTASLLSIEMLFKPIQRFFELNPISATQICTFLVPTTIIFQLFLGVSVNVMISTLFMIVAFISFVIIAYALYQSLILKKYAIRHQLLYQTLFDDFSHLVASERLSRDAIIASLSEDANQISPSLRGEIQHLLSKQDMTSFSPNPYINLVAFGLVKTYPNLHISLSNDLKELNVPIFCAWLELMPELMIEQFKCSYLSITLNPTMPHQIAVRVEGGHIPAKKMTQLTHPGYLHFITLKALQYWGSYLTLIYLTAELKLKGRLHLGEHTEIVFERSL